MNEIKGYKVKLDDKIKALNSTRVYKKITPLHDSTWYVKWVGTAGWLWVGFRWHDRALMVLNAILLFLLISSFVRFIVTNLV